MAADDAVCVDVGGPGGLMCKAGSAGARHCGCWLGRIHLRSWKRSGADREADQDLWVHTVQEVEETTESEGEIYLKNM